MIQDESHYEDIKQEVEMREKERSYIPHANDRIVKTVIQKMVDRSAEGQRKYGSTMWGEIERDDKNIMDFMTDVQEEMMDAILYMESAKECLRRQGFTHRLFTNEDES